MIHISCRFYKVHKMHTQYQIVITNITFYIFAQFLSRKSYRLYIIFCGSPKSEVLSQNCTLIIFLKKSDLFHKIVVSVNHRESPFCIFTYIMKNLCSSLPGNQILDFRKQTQNLNIRYLSNKNQINP